MWGLALSFGIFKSTRDPESAMSLVAHLLSPEETPAVMRESSGQFTPVLDRARAATRDYFNQNENYRTFGRAVDTLGLHPPLDGRRAGRRVGEGMTPGRAGGSPARPGRAGRSAARRLDLVALQRPRGLQVGAGRLHLVAARRLDLHGARGLRLHRPGRLDLVVRAGERGGRDEQRRQQRDRHSPKHHVVSSSCM
jgi:hypothetical protein